MPYLHWDISRKREQFASEIDRIVASSSLQKLEDEKRSKKARIDARTKLPKPDNFTGPHQRPTAALAREHSHVMAKIENIEEAVEAKRPFTKPFESRNRLGRFLLSAARLHESMTIYRDKMLLKKYLPNNPPIHPRRTLDQAFYWTLNSTKKRDKDQVVYRGTTTRPADFHRYNVDDGVFPDHTGLLGHCRTCTSNIKKVSRVVMVDQLWMWVLDEKTIITCFPKRYGANKQDYSGVHKSIRTRIESLGPTPIRTVFELALIILDECTKIFFDRTKTVDRQPQVLDEFSKAIGNIVSPTTSHDPFDPPLILM